MVKDFLQELKSDLPTSIAVDRKAWAKKIVEQNIPLEQLFNLLQEERKVATRFLWLLSDVGAVKPAHLFDALPQLHKKLQLSDKPERTKAFVTYWHICGVPESQEGMALDQCFQWLNSNDEKVYMKFHAMWVLKGLTKKYPEIKQELQTALEGQLDNNTPNFRKQALKMLSTL